jgi:type I restriction enzyme S subunit
MSSELEPIAKVSSPSFSKRWKPYPTYKDSGTEWLGEVPAHWDVTLLKRAFKVQLGKMLQTAPTHSQDTLEPYLRAANIFWNGVDLNYVNEMWFSPHEKEQYVLKAGDLLISEGGDVGRSAIWKGEIDYCYIQNAINRVRSRGVHLTQFLYYWIYSLKHSGYIDMLCNKATIAHFTAEKVERVNVILPPLPEQRAIAAFLDRETGRIDTLIAKKERQIELLQEKRAALISHAVTKGLDPDVKMKDSGVEWLGEVPEHWEVTPLRGVLNQRGEYNIGPRTTNILSVVKDVGVINYDDRKASGNKKSDNIEQYKIIHKGDIVLNRMNVIIGSVGVAGESGAASIEYYVLHAKDSSVHTEYYGHIFSSKMFQKNLGRLGSGILGHRLRIPFEVLKSEMLPKPPYSEQHDIANTLNDERNLIDKFVKKIQESISKLREYRTALISAAVTGKIDVRQEMMT